MENTKTEENNYIDENLEKMTAWMNNPQIDDETKQELSDLLEKYNRSGSQDLIDDINDRFYKDMTFGTGGLRGKIGAGTNRMNVYTVRRVSQAFSDYLNGKYEDPSIVIAYDNRKFSDVFAFESACVFASNNIRVWLFRELTPTPMLSFAVRELHTSGGVVVTASHNPKEYNGYKIYDDNGCQCLPDDAKQVSHIMENLDLFDDIKSCAQKYGFSETDKSTDSIKKVMKKAVTENPLIDYVPQQIDENYYNRVMESRVFSGMLNDVNVVYTPLNGTGNIPVTTVLKRGGIGNLYTVQGQELPDPEFTTCPRPNPEETDALKEGLKLWDRLNRDGKSPDILMATDPDSDRIGVMIKDNGEYKKLDGNQIGILLFDYILTRLKDKGFLPENPVMITTIVSTPMSDLIAKDNGIHVDKVLTGFKFIGDKINEYEKKGEESRFIFGFEESCGYLADTYARDKDAVSAALLIGDMTGYLKSQGKTLMGRMEELYKIYGCYLTEQENIQKEGQRGAEEIENIMASFRNPELFSEFKLKLVEFLDYEAQTKRTMGLFEGEEGGCSMAIGTRPMAHLPKENVLEFNFKDRTKVVIRPSGTEPKIKIYFTVVSETKDKAEKKMKMIKDDILRLL